MAKIEIKKINKDTPLDYKSLINKWQFKPDYPYDFIDNKKLAESFPVKFKDKSNQGNIFGAEGRYISSNVKTNKYYPTLARTRYA